MSRNSYFRDAKCPGFFKVSKHDICDFSTVGENLYSREQVATRKREEDV
jgi:hypothetical protein